MDNIHAAMSEEISKAFEADMAGVQEGIADAADASPMSLIAHAFLRLWTRLALETGQKLEMVPSQYSLGTYGGQMGWTLNNAALEGLDRIEIRGTHGKPHSLVAEQYTLDGAARARVLFSLGEEEVRGKPVFVSYLVYDEAVKKMDGTSVAGPLASALAAWSETIMTRNEKPLWEYARDNLECVGL